MGEVYRALDTRLNREVAVKFVSDQFLGQAFGSGTPSTHSAGLTPATHGTLSHRRFLREAQASSALNHPNICTIYDIGEQNGQPYLVMELLRGETLKDALREGPLSPEEVLAFARQGASALAAAHALGIIHRDIKPANLYVVGTPGKRQIKILDFGLAKRHGVADVKDSAAATAAFAGEVTAPGDNGDLTGAGSTMGTVAYMSPEQARGQVLDARTDLFSLGTVIYEMATGQKPFDGPSAADVFVALLTRDAPPITTVNPLMPRDLNRIVAKLVARDKEKRYQKADDVLLDLEAADVHGVQSSATSVAVAAMRDQQRAADSSSRSRRIPVNARNIAGAAMIGLLFVGLLTWWSHRIGGAANAAPGYPVSGAAADNPAAEAAPALAKDSIILASFSNHTGDPAFDTTLNEALRIDLEQSPVLNIVSADHLRHSMHDLGKPEDTPVTLKIAREIGEREGTKAILTGTIAKLGKRYVIMLAAQNAANGDEIASEQETSPDKEHVLDALSKAAAGMRAKLGEDTDDIARNKNLRSR